MKNKQLRITMPDNSVWDIPVMVIAEDRAAYYSHEYGGDIHKSLKEDTLPLFESDEYHIRDWASNSMNWSDVKDVAKMISSPEIDYQEGWMNGDYEVISS